MSRIPLVLIVVIAGCTKQKSDVEQWEAAKNWGTQSRRPKWEFDEGAVKLPKIQFAVVTRNEAQAIEELKDVYFKPITNEQVSQYIERPLVGDGKPFLLRGVAIHPGDEEWSVIRHPEYVIVEYCGNPHGLRKPDQRKVIIAILPEAPKEFHTVTYIAD